MILLAGGAATAAAYGVVTSSVLARHIDDYTAVWAVVAGLGAVGVSLSACCPETLAPPRDTSGAFEEARDLVSGRASVPGKAAGALRAAPARLCLPLRLMRRCCCPGRGHGTLETRGGDLPSDLPSDLPAASPLAPCSNPVLRFAALLSVPLTLAATSLNMLDGWALLAFQGCAAAASPPPGRRVAAAWLPRDRRATAV